MPVAFRAVLVAAFVCAAASSAAAQMSASDLVLRLDQLEHQMRALTGQIEQLQFRNQQLEQQLRRMQEDSDFRFQQMGGAPAQQPSARPPAQQAAPQQAPDIHSGPSPIRPVAPGRRGDAFDPNQNPNAPGAPRPLGGLPPGQPSAPQTQIMSEEQEPARGREPGAPLDLATLSGNVARDPGQPQPQYAPPAGQMAAVQPQTPKEHFDLAYDYAQRKDFATAETGFREFVRRYPNDRLTPDAHFWLGETFFQRQRYRDAAESYLTVTTKHETAAKAPDALLRLGQSLAAMGQKDMACASFAQVERKYPRAALSVRQGVEREIKRVRC